MAEDLEFKVNNLPQLAEYTFDLPQELVAQTPPAERGQSRLMLLDRARPEVSLHHFSSLPDLLPSGALLVFNQVRVSLARLLGRRAGSGGQAEAFILEPPAPGSAPGIYDLWCLVHPGRRIKPGQELVFTHPESEITLQATALAFDEEGRRLVRFNFNDEPEKILSAIGHVPLPAYIKRPDEKEDRERYQTVYGRTPGAVAAPTAGLHFTDEMLDRLKNKGFDSAEVTLKVSAGTFASLTQKQLDSGRLHREHISVPEETVQKIGRAKGQGRPVVAVGTTSVRSLEWAAEDGGLRAREGWADIFIRPGYEFKVVDALITNFHFPASSLLMLVSALAGKERILSAYRQAVEARFRFYSYGDAMLIK